MESGKRTDVNKLGEFGLINHLTNNFKTKINRSTLYGVGDDAAVIDKNTDEVSLVSTDMLVEGIHFDLVYTPLKYLGYKSVVVNLSDIYAMNGIPKQITVSIAISNRYSVEALEEFYEGIKMACDQYNIDLIGGDTTSSLKGLVISITAIGVGQKGKVAYRSGAQLGDLICITGDLGAAYLGLQILEREKQVFLASPTLQPEFDKQDYLIKRLLRPEARKDVIEMMAQNQLVPTSMIDISDGLGSELYHICSQSGVGAFIEESGVPIHNDTQMKAIEFNMDPITTALSGGEDYELLFTISPSEIDKVKFLPDIYIAGEIVPQSEKIKLHTVKGNIHPIIAQGWNHFNQD